MKIVTKQINQWKYSQFTINEDIVQMISLRRLHPFLFLCIIKAFLDLFYSNRHLNIKFQNDCPTYDYL